MGTTKSPGPNFKWERGRSQKIFHMEEDTQSKSKEIRGELSNWSQPLVKAWRHMKAWLIEERIADFV